MTSKRNVRESLAVLLRALKLPTFVAMYVEAAELAEKKGWSVEEYLHHLASHELEERKQRRMERNLKQASLPEGKTLATLKLNKLPPKVRIDSSFLLPSETRCLIGMLPKSGRWPMDEGISREARQELLRAVRQRYANAKRADKGKILDEFVAVAGCHRKHAIRLLGDAEKGASLSRGVGERVYGEAVKEALTIVWEAADRICGKRLKAVLPDLVVAMERHGHMRLDPEVRERLGSVSAATIDRLLAPVRGQAKGRRKRRTAKRVSKEVAVRTFADWKDPVPGYLEIDFVAHCGGSMGGTFIHSFGATDVCSGWIEAVPLLAREQSLVVEGLDVISCQFPVPVLGIDSDNDGAFINDTVINYCRAHGLEFTRSRPYQKNDQAWIEQKNGAVIRRFVGYDRYAGLVAGQTLAQLYSAVRLYVNYFQPSFKLLEKTRDGAKVRKRYDKPATPCDRLLAHKAVGQDAKRALGARRSQLDPLQLLHRIREVQAALVALSSPEPSTGPGRENLEQFLAQLPQLWQMGEVRPTHRQRTAARRHWRTRKDPFERAWPEILGRLQNEPDATAKSILDRLNTSDPEQYSDGQLRTLQRRIRQWRNIMAKKLVLGGIEGGEEITPVGPASTREPQPPSPGAPALPEPSSATP